MPCRAGDPGILPPEAVCPMSPAQSPPVVGPTSPRLKTLDGLRSWVLLVMLAHFANLSGNASEYWGFGLFLSVVNVAFVGLDVFFVLSGFLITGILLDTRGSASYFRTFYARRAIRVFPLYYGFLVLYFFALPSLAAWKTSELDLSPTQHATYWVYLQNFAAGLGPLWDAGAQATFLRAHTSHLWSLAVEEQFYLVWPAVVYFCGGSSLRRVCLFCALAAPFVRIFLVVTLGGVSEAAYLLTPARLDGLAIGSLMALAAREPAGLATWLAWAKPGVLGGAMILVAVFVYRGQLDSADPVFQIVGLTASAYIAAGLVAMAIAARAGGTWQRLLSRGPLQAIGRCSYAIYVLHLPLAYVLDRSNLLSRGYFDQWIDHRLLAELAYSTAMILVSIGAGMLSWHLYEKQFLKLRRWLPYDARSTSRL